MQLDKEFDSLDNLVKEAIFKRSIEKRHDGGLGYRESQRGHYRAANTKNPNCRPCYKEATKADPYGYVPMEIDKIQTRRLPSGPQKGKKQQKGGKKMFKCHECGKFGHIRKDCRSKVNMVH